MPAHPRHDLDGPRVGAAAASRARRLARRSPPSRAAAAAPRRRATAGARRSAAHRSASARSSAARRPAPPPARTAPGPARWPRGGPRPRPPRGSHCRRRPSARRPWAPAPPPARGGRRPARRARDSARRHGRGCPRRRARGAWPARPAAARRRRRRGSAGGGRRSVPGPRRGAPGPAPCAPGRPARRPEGSPSRSASASSRKLGPEHRGVLERALLVAAAAGRGARRSRPGRCRGGGRRAPRRGSSTIRLRDLLGEERIAARRPRRRAAASSRIASGSRATASSVDGLRGQRAQLDLGDVARRAAEVGPALEQLRPARAEHQERRVVEPLNDDLLDQVEQAVVGPVRVVDPDHQRPLAGQQGDEPAPCALQLVLDVAVYAPRRRGPCREGVRRARPRRRRPALREPLGERVVDARRPSPRRWRRPRRAGSRRAPRRRSRGRTAGCGPRRLRRRVGRRAQLGDSSLGEPRLADPGLAGDRDQLGHPLAGGSAVDQLAAGRGRRRGRRSGRRRPACRSVPRGHGAPDAEGLPGSPCVDRPRPLELGRRGRPARFARRPAPRRAPPPAAGAPRR